MANDNYIDVWDFDGTIYNGQSWIDFYLFIQNKGTSFPLMWERAFKLFFMGMIPYRLGHEEFKKDNKLCSLVTLVPDIAELAEMFWESHMHKIDPEYLERVENGETINDIIATVSPDFQMKYISKKLKVKDLICTKVDLNTGSLIGSPSEKNDNKIVGAFCAGEEKLIRIREKYDEPIRNVYTDSYHDGPLIDAAKNAFKKDKKTGIFIKVK